MYSRVTQSDKDTKRVPKMNSTQKINNKKLETNADEEIKVLFNQATLVSDEGIFIEDDKLKKLVSSLYKTKSLRRTRVVLQSFIKDIIPRLNKSQPTVSQPLIYNINSQD